MPPVQVKIIEALEGSAESMSLNDLVTNVQKSSQATAPGVKAAILPLISSEKVDLTPDRKVRLKR